MQKKMKKFLKTIVLIPMWPLIWHQLGFDLKGTGEGWYGIQCKGECWGCGDNNKILEFVDIIVSSITGTNDCCQRANLMVEWWHS